MTVARLIELVGAVLRRYRSEPPPAVSPALEHWLLGHDNAPTQVVAPKRQPVRAIGRAHAGFHPDREDD